MVIANSMSATSDVGVLALLLCLLPSVESLSVNISFSFYVPEEFGLATPSSANCCPNVNLPENKTYGMVTPTVFGIGTQKGGTTTLYAYFTRNKLIHGTTKELHFLDSAASSKNKNIKTYLSRWKHNANILKAKTDKTAMPSPLKGPLFEISPSYLLVPFSACRAKHIAPNGKFIVLLRDPTDRAFSGFTYTTNVVKRRRRKKVSWTSETFLSVVRKGLDEVKSDPDCSFQSGQGSKSYNDCFGCILRSIPLQSKCAERPFVKFGSAKDDYECTSIGKEVVIRGLYGAQLAWWFTLIPPSQFLVFNSIDFFKDPSRIMFQVIEFLGVSQKYTEAMLKKNSRANKGHYHSYDQHEVDVAKGLLREYYKRPNLELYRLLDETEHHEFTPFDKEYEGVTSLQCTDLDNHHSVDCKPENMNFQDDTSRDNLFKEFSEIQEIKTPNSEVYEDVIPINIQHQFEDEISVEEQEKDEEDVSVEEQEENKDENPVKEQEKAEDDNSVKEQENAEDEVSVEVQENSNAEVSVKEEEIAENEIDVNKQDAGNEVVVETEDTSEEETGVGEDQATEAVKLTKSNVQMLTASSMTTSRPFRSASNYYIHLFFGFVLIGLLIYGIKLKYSRNSISRQRNT